MQSFRFIGAMVSEFGFFKKVKGLTNKLYAYALVEENWFTCKISGSLVLWLVCFDMDLVCIIMYCQDT